MVSVHMMQVDVVKSFNDSDGPQWKHSLFGNPNDPETFRFMAFLSAPLIDSQVLDYSNLL